MGRLRDCEPLYVEAGVWHGGRLSRGLGIVAAMTSESESTAQEPEGRAIEVTDPELPDFAPRRTLSRLASSEGSAVGVDYEGDDSALLTADEREAFVRAAMERDEGA
jgi:hypothetical protein